MKPTKGWLTGIPKIRQIRAKFIDETKSAPGDVFPR
jgi:hypothetical protein